MLESFKKFGIVEAIHWSSRRKDGGRSRDPQILPRVKKGSSLMGGGVI
jgi:hypothetical protein